MAFGGMRAMERTAKSRTRRVFTSDNLSNFDRALVEINKFWLSFASIAKVCYSSLSSFPF